MAKKVLGTDPFKRGTETTHVSVARKQAATKGSNDRSPSLTAAPPSQLEDGPKAHADSPTIASDPIPHDAAPVVAAIATAPVRTDPTLSLFESIRSTSKGIVKAIQTAAGLSNRDSKIDAWGQDVALTSALRPFGDWLIDRYWRVDIGGAEQIPQGSCILVANHAGALPIDGPVLHLAIQRARPDLPESRWLLEDELFYAPCIGVLANRLGAVRASPENALALLAEGRPLVVFPEGIHGLSKPFADRYQLRRFGRGGYLKIAIRARVPVIPVAIVGGEEAMPLLAKLPGRIFGMKHLPLTVPPLPTRWYIRFGAPVDLTGAPSEPERDLAWIDRTNLRVRDTIEAMIKTLLKSRSGVF